MINSLYVIDAGVCIYSHVIHRGVFIDEQLLSGFLTAIGTFAHEAFKSGLQTIEIQNGLKIAFYLEPQFKLIFCTIEDVRDNNHLIGKILGEISAEFTTSMSEVLKTDEKRHKIDEYQQFDEALAIILQVKAKQRNIKTLFWGLLAGVAILVGLILIVYEIIMLFASSLSYENAVSVFVLCFSFTVALANFTSGYIAGNPRMGLLNGGFFFFILNLIVVNLDATLYSYFIRYFFVTLLIVNMAAGYAGGLFCDRRKLYVLLPPPKL